MHVFDPYRPATPDWSRRLVDEHPFALLVTERDGIPRATHVPVFWAEPHAEEGTPLEGSVLLGHLAADNDQCQDLLRPDAHALVIVSGPHAYISPTAYQKTPAAPTWNYAAVHLTGHAWVLNRDETLDVVKRTSEHLESHRDPAWDITPSLGYANRILSGVCAFGLRIADVKAQFKLSQDKSPEIRERVRNYLLEDRTDASPALETWMQRAENYADARLPS